jgi:hypothetical protein
VEDIHHEASLEYDAKERADHVSLVFEFGDYSTSYIFFENPH